MLRDEARLIARVHHANVVDVIDVLDDGAELLLVMEYIHGPPLTAIAAALPLPIAGAIIADVLEGLHAAHEARSETGEPLQVVHRDVSPSNIIVGADGVTRVLDFGVAHAADRLQRTVPGQVKGKPWYMAPEQALGDAIDRRVDVYATAVVLWELLAGERLFPAETATGAMLRHTQEQPAPPSRHRAEVSLELDAVVLRGLAKRAGDRFATAREMADALASVLPAATDTEVAAWLATHARAFFAQRDAIVATAERAATTTTATTVAPAPRRPRRRVAIAVAAAAIAAGTFAWIATRRADAPDAPAAPVAAPTPRGTRATPIKIVVPAFANRSGDADLDARPRSCATSSTTRRRWSPACFARAPPRRARSARPATSTTRRGRARPPPSTHRRSRSAR
jgi:serine/threonine-protein kinase